MGRLCVGQMMFIACLFIFTSCGEVKDLINGSGSTAASIDNGALKSALFSKINIARSQGGRTTVSQHFGADQHAQAAAQKNLDNYLSGARGDQQTGLVGHCHYVNHGCDSVSTAQGQINAELALGFKVRENLYSTTDPNITQRSMDEIADIIANGWIGSALHALNLYSPAHFGLGIGIASGVDSRGRATISVSAEFVCTNC